MGTTPADRLDLLIKRGEQLKERGKNLREQEFNLVRDFMADVQFVCADMEIDPIKIWENRGSETYYYFDPKTGELLYASAFRGWTAAQRTVNIIGGRVEAEVVTLEQMDADLSSGGFYAERYLIPYIIKGLNTALVSA